MGAHGSGVHRDVPVDLTVRVGGGLDLLEQIFSGAVRRPQPMALVHGLPWAEPLCWRRGSTRRRHGRRCQSLPRNSWPSATGSRPRSPLSRRDAMTGSRLPGLWPGFEDDVDRGLGDLPELAEAGALRQLPYRCGAGLGAERDPAGLGQGGRRALERGRRVAERGQRTGRDMARAPARQSGTARPAGALSPPHAGRRRRRSHDAGPRRPDPRPQTALPGNAPRLRRIYSLAADPVAALSQFAPLGFARLPDGTAEIGGTTYHALHNDFGPSSIDGWLTDLAAREMLIDDHALLDPGRRRQQRRRGRDQRPAPQTR
jgi:hypothetical protein